jgi:tetratricopeptide (TPR) repeat protein
MADHDALDDDDRTDAMPKVSPAYADAEMRGLGERLASLYQARDVERGDGPGGAGDLVALAEEIARIRSRMRRGSRLHAGEFLKDGRYRLVSRQPGHTRGDEHWAAWDRRSQEMVFVRVFHGEWVDDEPSVAEFRQRGELLQKLSHPHIGRLLDADRSEDGFVILVTRMVGATTLADVRLDPTDAVQMAIELAQALAHAHDHGVVHGAIRPDNVRLEADGHAWLVGFSVEADGRGDVASLYRAPESAERGYVPRPASDVYALGMTMLATLNGGELPFWVLRDPARLIASVPVPDSIKVVIGRATDWDLGSRYQDLAAFIGELVADGALVEGLGARARTKGRFATAAEHYETLLRLQPPRGVEIRTLLGQVYTDLGATEPSWLDLAFQHLLAALERTPDVESLFEPLRTVASRTGDWTRLAQALWTQARARDPGRRVVLRTELARINQQELGNAVAAAETWTQVLADHRLPGQASVALRALQELARSRADWKGFVEYGQELLSYLEGDERSRVDYAIGRAYLEHLNDEDRGLHFIDRAEAAGYSEVDLGARLQGLRAQRGQWQRVIQLMIQQAAAQDIAEASPTLLRAGIIATSVHLDDEALSVYHALLERAPRHVVALRHLARMHHRSHEHVRALPYYERLWDTYRGKESEEPEASERAADCTAYAQILLARGQVPEAVERLDEALRLNPNHVPTLELAGPLFLVRGDAIRAGHVFERMLSLFKSVELSPQKIAACLGMGELAWMQGRLTAAMGWYNRSLELDPFSVAAWWGLAKVALTARAGHPGTERAPWVMAMPQRATGWEALARLLVGLVRPAALRNWLTRSAMGRGFLEDVATEPSALRLASAVVDVMVRHDLVDADLFRRLGDTAPEWAEPIDEVHRLLLGDGAATFPIVRTYRWVRPFQVGSRPFADFPELEPRTVLPMDVAVVSVGVDHLDDAESWHALLGGERTGPPAPFTMIEPTAEITSARFPGPVGALVRDGFAWVVLDTSRAEVVVGSAPDTDLQLPEDHTIRARHLRLFRQGSRVYAEASPGARVQIDGEDRRIWRLVGGERVTVGETRLQYQQYEDAARIPPRPPGVEAAAKAAPPAPPAPLAPPPAPAAPLAPPPEAPPVVAPVAVVAAPVVAAPVVAAPVVAAPVVAAPAPTPMVAAPPVVPASGALGEQTGPLESPLPMPARSYEPQTPSEPVQMPGDVMGPTTGPLPSLDDDEPASDEELLHVLQGRAGASVPSAGSDLSGTDDGPSEEGEPAADAITTRVDPEEVAQAVRAAESVDEVVVGDDDADDDDPEESTAARVEPPRPPTNPTPVPMGRTAVPDVEDDESDDPHDPAQHAPAWLRDALVAEARRATVSYPPPAAERVTQELPAVPATPPPPSERPAPKGLIPAPLPAPVATGEPSVPLVPVAPISAQSPLSAPPIPPGPDGGGFGFGDEFAEDDVASFTSELPKLPSGVVGPSAVPAMVPVERKTPVSGARTVPLASVEFLYGPDRGRRVVVHDVLTIGSGTRCGISLPNDPRLSPVHCRVEKTARGYWLRDEQSSSGTVVNGKRVTDQELKGGDVIMVGRTALRFNLEPA